MAWTASPNADADSSLRVPELEEYPTDFEESGNKLLGRRVDNPESRNRRKYRQIAGAFVLVGLAVACVCAITGRSLFPASLSENPNVVGFNAEKKHASVPPVPKGRVPRAPPSDCWPLCDKAGWCSACGTGKACCRLNWNGPQPPECLGVGGIGEHSCVSPLARAGEQCGGLGVDNRSCVAGYVCKAVDQYRSECLTETINATVAAYARCSWTEAGIIWTATCASGTMCRHVPFREESLCLPIDLLNPGKDCWAPCGGRGGQGGGSCAWCGIGNACCRKGYLGDPPECHNAVYLSGTHHECVVPAGQFTQNIPDPNHVSDMMGLALPSAPQTFSSNMAQVPGNSPVLHWAQDCWTLCGAGGDCAMCGPGNACCRQGWDGDPEECKGVTLFSSREHHVCVAPVHPVRVKHKGQPCMSFCNNKGGYCDWCGEGNACCSPGMGSIHKECAGVTNFPGVPHATCVAPALPHVTCRPGEIEQHGRCVPAEKPVPMTFYVYKAAGDGAEENAITSSSNVGSLAGVMWYLHNEVVTSCPRKNQITRVLRYRLTMMNTESLYTPAPHAQFGPYHGFKAGVCAASTCGEDVAKFGYTVGCQVLPDDIASYRPSPVWYSLPKEGFCEDPTGAANCTWHWEPAGEVRIDDLSGIEDYALFCEEANKEYSPDTDHGVGTMFWDSKADPERCADRLHTLARLFQMKYPGFRSFPDEPRCDWWR
eukprot:TRINITY_DN17837_c0_g1_i1.p1 TRINITY_DN17837_c0_g1~~TRINITY_DN17837_c0_g1_i1.p1  ORF type:complete len:710 (-),score=60.46 TRINITY_DN17837_c0_g1_i1:90-2219(-)